MVVKSPQNCPRGTVRAERLLARIFVPDSAALCRHVLYLQRQLSQGSCHDGSRNRYAVLKTSAHSSYSPAGSFTNTSSFIVASLDLLPWSMVKPAELRCLARRQSGAGRRDRDSLGTQNVHQDAGAHLLRERSVPERKRAVSYASPCSGLPYWPVELENAAVACELGPSPLDALRSAVSPLPLQDLIFMSSVAVALCFR